MLKDIFEKVESNFVEKLIDSKVILNVIFFNNVSLLLNEILDSLNIVIVVFIMFVVLFVFVVFYNLININVLEWI